MSARLPQKAADQDSAGPRRNPSPAFPRRFRSPAAAPRGSSSGRWRSVERGKVLHRPFSEPALWLVPNYDFDDGVGGSHVESLPRFFTCTDVCSPPTGVFSPSSPRSMEEGGGRYTEESKVVVSVTVEGSVGPVMVLVKLGATVEEAIGIVVDKYGKEGRRPPLGCDASSSFQLYHSYFCFQGLNKSEKLGEVGGRNFYLRRIKNSDNNNIVENGHDEIVNAIRNPVHPMQLFLSFIIGRLSKLGRRTRKLWKLLGCSSCGL